MKTIYELKEYKNSKHPDLTKALIVYSQNIDPAMKTDTKEILYWIDKYNKTFEDTYHILGFYINNTLIGFCQLAYFVLEKFVIIDYLAIDKTYRKNNTFYEFVEKVKEFVALKNFQINFGVIEIGFYNQKSGPPESIRVLIRLLKLCHFGVLKCNYYLPRLGKDNYESEMIGILLMYSVSENKQINKKTFFQIVNAIYFKYYMRWYSIFFDEKTKNKYYNSLKEKLLLMEKELKKFKTIEINGFKGSYPFDINAKSTVLQSKPFKFIIIIGLFVFWLVILGILYFYLEAYLGMDVTLITSVIYASVVITLFIFSIMYEKKSNKITKLFSKIFN